ncbi:hypothetical protein [Massilibacteroides sp.]|uniref:hypothetical protein n=1 Tax=Massilibacteroides sp. TaxID=2034766 RepID=UPI002605AF16|nr:hypothetical protein [Massilibacteroides sp.]MDD4515724.1 hypothetical protein [Massilibacteroides sp.]
MENKKINFDDTLSRIYERDKKSLLRIPKRYTFGDLATCEDIFYQAFRTIDKSVREIEKLPEYSEIIRWMSDTQGKGLLLTGDCGRGKSTIGCGVIPLIFAHFANTRITPISAESIVEKMDKLIPEADYFNVHSGYAIDDLGCESLANNYGNKYEPAVRLINEIEAKIKTLIITTNLTPEQLLDRYGVRTMDRLIRLCKVIKFKGKSLRK